MLPHKIDQMIVIDPTQIPTLRFGSLPNRHFAKTYGFIKKAEYFKPDRCMVYGVLFPLDGYRDTILWFKESELL